MHFARGDVDRVSSCLSIVRRFVYVRTDLSGVGAGLFSFQLMEPNPILIAADPTLYFLRLTGPGRREVLSLTAGQ